MPQRVLKLYSVRPLWVTAPTLTDQFSSIADTQPPPSWAQTAHQFVHECPDAHRRVLALHLVARQGSTLPAEWSELLLVHIYAPVHGDPAQLPFWLYMCERLSVWQSPWTKLALGQRAANWAPFLRPTHTITSLDIDRLTPEQLRSVATGRPVAPGGGRIPVLLFGDLSLPGDDMWFTLEQVLRRSELAGPALRALSSIFNPSSSTALRDASSLLDGAPRRTITRVSPTGHSSALDRLVLSSFWQQRLHKLFLPDLGISSDISPSGVASPCPSLPTKPPPLVDHVVKPHPSSPAVNGMRRINKSLLLACHRENKP